MDAARPSSDARVTVYFDGLCHLCSREIEHYRGLRGAENIAFVDITSSHFEAAREGLDPRRIHESLHARDREGRLHTGVDAFVCIWRELPALRRLATWAEWRPVSVVLRAAYAGFAKIRPLLPRKSCESSPYCEHHGSR